MLLLAQAMVFAGAGLLIASLLPVSRMVLQLPPSAMRAMWYVLTLLVTFFIFAFLVYGVRLGADVRPPDMMVPSVFLAAACFVLLVNNLALETADSIRRLAVLEQESITDPLTGAYNRRFLERRLEQEIARARRYDCALSVLVLDIDRFKVVNDTYGHPFGDTLLRGLVEIVHAVSRKSDMAARYGGEEFVVVAPSTAARDAAVLAERLRRAVESEAVAVPKDAGPQADVRLTVSIGVAELHASMHTPGDLIAAADKALYEAKRRGRNRVAVLEQDEFSCAPKPQAAAHTSTET